MPDNRIDASLSAADSQAVMDAINTIRVKLPFLLVTLSAAIQAGNARTNRARTQRH